MVVLLGTITTIGYAKGYDHRMLAANLNVRIGCPEPVCAVLHAYVRLRPYSIYTKV